MSRVFDNKLAMILVPLVPMMGCVTNGETKRPERSYRRELSAERPLIDRNKRIKIDTSEDYFSFVEKFAKANGIDFPDSYRLKFEALVNEVRQKLEAQSLLLKRPDKSQVIRIIDIIETALRTNYPYPETPEGKEGKDVLSILSVFKNNESDCDTRVRLVLAILDDLDIEGDCSQVKSLGHSYLRWENRYSEKGENRFFKDYINFELNSFTVELMPDSYYQARDRKKIKKQSLNKERSIAEYYTPLSREDSYRGGLLRCIIDSRRAASGENKERNFENDLKVINSVLELFPDNGFIRQKRVELISRNISLPNEKDKKYIAAALRDFEFLLHNGENGHAFFAQYAFFLSVTMKDERKALEMINRAIALNPNIAYYYSNKGNFLRALGREKEAKEQMSLAEKVKAANKEKLKDNSKREDLSLSLLVQCQKMFAGGDKSLKAKFEVLVRNSLREFPENKSILEAIYACYRFLDDDDKLIEISDKILELDPSDSLALIHSYSARVGKGGYVAGIDFLLNSKLSRDSKHSYGLLASSYGYLGNQKKQIEYLKKDSRIYFYNKLIRYKLFDFLMAKKLFKEAQAELNEISTLDPTDRMVDKKQKELDALVAKKALERKAENKKVNEAKKKAKAKRKQSSRSRKLNRRKKAG